MQYIFFKCCVRKVILMVNSYNWDILPNKTIILEEVGWSCFILFKEN